MACNEWVYFEVKHVLAMIEPLRRSSKSVGFSTLGSRPWNGAAGLYCVMSWDRWNPHGGRMVIGSVPHCGAPLARLGWFSGRGFGGFEVCLLC